MNRILSLLDGRDPVPESAPPLHPYSPSTLVMPHFKANDTSDVRLLFTIGSAFTLIFVVSWMLMSQFSPRLKTTDRVVILWFILCGTLHTFFEGYYLLNHARMSGLSDVFAQLWKEYALSDSRYLTSDTFVLAAETMTLLVLAPLSYSMVYLIATSSPYRAPVQIMVCFGHIYSDSLYYATSFLDHHLRGVNHCRLEPYYFWVYYVGMNAVWIVVPGVLLLQAVAKTSRAFAALDRMARSMQANGHVRKPKET